MRNLWARFVRWIAREYITYLEYENKELRFELQRWHDRYEGAISAVKVFEARYNYMEKTIADSVVLNPKPLIIPKTNWHRSTP